jgi:hypothetical protein
MRAGRSIVTRRGRPEAPPRPATQADACRVVVDVRGHQLEVPLVLDDAGLEATLEQMTLAVVAPVEAHRVQPVQPLHSRREPRLRRLDEQVEVIVEQHPGVDLPAETPLDFDEELEPSFAVEVVDHDHTLLDAATDDVVPRRARQRGTRNTRHDGTLARRTLTRNRR